MTLDKLVFDIESMVRDAGYPTDISRVSDPILLEFLEDMAYDSPFSPQDHLVSLSVYYHALNNDTNRFGRAYAAALDSQTQTYQKEYFERKFLPRSIAKATEYGFPLCYGIIDIDNFSTFNNEYGHLAGDIILKAVSDVLRMNRKNGDENSPLVEVGRIGGGEEFGIIMYNISPENAYKIMERIRISIENTIVSMGGLNVNVRASGGLAVYRSGMTVEDLSNEADLYLLNAKAQGKNRTVGKENYVEGLVYTPRGAR